MLAKSPSCHSWTLVQHSTQSFPKFCFKNYHHPLAFHLLYTTGYHRNSPVELNIIDYADHFTEPRHVVYGVPQGQCKVSAHSFLCSSPRRLEISSKRTTYTTTRSRMIVKFTPPVTPVKCTNGRPGMHQRDHRLDNVLSASNKSVQNRINLVHDSKTGENIQSRAVQTGRRYTVETSTSVRNLEAYIDSDMGVTTHINHLVRTCCYHLRRIKHIRRFITTKTAILLVNSFVIPRVEYCNSLLAGLPTCHLHRIPLVLNAAARMLYRG